MRILVINPMLSRLTALGACEQDRLANLDELTRLGHDILLLTRHSKHHSLDEHRAFYQRRGHAARVEPYFPDRLNRARLRDLAFLDGAAWEYADPAYCQVVEDTIREFKPDVVWCHATYNWEPAARARKMGIPTVIRSVNYESRHMLQEDKYSAANLVRFIGKEIGEHRAKRFATVLAAITPDEERLYQGLRGGGMVRLLPLRTMPGFLRPAHPVTERKPLRVFFMGASYNVPHNRAALEFIAAQVVPLIRDIAPGTFEFHVMGSKMPEALKTYAAPDLILDGYVEDLEAHLATMDIALSPSRFGQGMQQKVFEPLCRGFPTITSPRALAGYPFESEVSVLLADDAESYARQLIRLKDPALRSVLSANAAARAHSLFNQDFIDRQVAEILELAFSAKPAALLAGK